TLTRPVPTIVDGETPDLAGFAVDGLLNQDTVEAVPLTSAGVAGTARVRSYDIVASDATGSGLSNYTIDYIDGVLSVTPAALAITALDAAKVYGEVLDPTGFAVDGLLNQDTVEAVTLASAGAAGTAGVGGYDIVASDATGSGLSNYTIDYIDGVLSVTPAALAITALDAAKVYGEVLDLTGFAVDGLLNQDTVEAVTLTSAGAAGTAGVGGYDIVASDATGSGLSNYTIDYIAGVLSVTPGALAITALAAAKVYGAVLDLTGFAVEGLLT